MFLKPTVEAKFLVAILSALLTAFSLVGGERAPELQGAVDLSYPTPVEPLNPPILIRGISTKYWPQGPGRPAR